jgi:hypothetical protein
MLAAILLHTTVCERKLELSPPLHLPSSAPSTLVLLSKKGNDGLSIWKEICELIISFF